MIFEGLSELVALIVEKNYELIKVKKFVGISNSG